MPLNVADGAVAEAGTPGVQYPPVVFHGPRTHSPWLYVILNFQFAPPVSGG